MKYLFFVFLISVSLHGYSGNKYNFSGSTGTVTVDGNGNAGGHSMAHGDTMLMPANGAWQGVSFQNLNGLLSDSIVIIFLPGSVIGSTCTFCNGEWTNVSFVKVVNLYSHNNGSVVVLLKSNCHDIRVVNSQFLNDAGNYTGKQALIADDKYGSFYFDGTDNSTFHHIQYDGCKFSGFENVQAVLLGSDTVRSICRDFKFVRDTFTNFRQTYANAPNAIFAGCFQIDIRNCYFHGMAIESGACQCAHIEWINLYGNGYCINNTFDSSYANDVRLVPLQWKGLAGYTGPFFYIGNLSRWHESYSAIESNTNAAQTRIDKMPAGMLYRTQTKVWFNTVFRTRRNSYNGDYYGFICDAYADSISVWYNVIIGPEEDRTYDPATRKYIVSTPQGTPAQLDTGSNRQYRYYTDAGIADTANWALTSSSPLADQVDGSHATGVAADATGTARPQNSLYDIGSIERLFISNPYLRFLLLKRK